LLPDPLAGILPNPLFGIDGDPRSTGTNATLAVEDRRGKYGLAFCYGIVRPLSITLLHVGDVSYQRPPGWSRIVGFGSVAFLPGHLKSQAAGWDHDNEQQL